MARRPRTQARPLHRWDLPVAEARAVQERLRGRVVRHDRLGPVRRVAGVDVSYDRGSPMLYAAVVVLDATSLETLEVSAVRREASFPYVPGYLSFRELPPVIAAFERLRERPDLVVCDAQGLAHPRRFGLACHLGVWLGLPSIGCAKSVLVGSYREPGTRRGCHTRLLDAGETLGEAVRTRDAVKPVFVSVGHRVSLETARRWVLRLARTTRLPETTRAAHAEVNRLRRLGSV
jgi:deoxyribonuclease V